MRWRRAWPVLAALLGAVAACGASNLPVGSPCSSNSECASSACDTTSDCSPHCVCVKDSDCPSGQRCTISTDCGSACVGPCGSSPEPMACFSVDAGPGEDSGASLLQDSMPYDSGSLVEDSMPNDASVDSLAEAGLDCAYTSALPKCPSSASVPCTTVVCGLASLPTGEACAVPACAMAIDPCPGADLVFPSRVDSYACSCDRGRWNCELCLLGAGICAPSSDGATTDSAIVSDTGAPDTGVQ
jgi:hypothetical protein